LIVGLGNPGPEYRETRHNTGFLVLNGWARQLGVSSWRRGFQSRHARSSYEGKSIHLLCPQTFMNRSGSAVRACAVYHRFGMGNILVVHDDVDLPVGRVRVARNGGAGGHKGVVSIITELGSRAFSRVKVGIGRPRYGESVEQYVLEPFYEDQKAILNEAIPLAVRACELVVSKGVEGAMNLINCQNFANKEVSS
jgi:PTH1 family peptidyl-tRNA hydrolase